VQLKFFGMVPGMGRDADVIAEPDWIAIDWGTSNLRAWGVGSAAETTFFSSSDRGMGRLAREDYPGALSELLAGLAPDGPPIDVIICGMAGARQGWLEAPYLAAPTDLGDLLARAVRPPLPGSRLLPRILPGVCQTSSGAEDVMRGEETQLLGLATLMPGFAGVVCMPGTHSKWAALDGRRVERFASAMTGELFEVLRLHSVLRHSFSAEVDPADTERGLADGLAAGLAAPHKLPTQLFKVRAASLVSNRQAGWCKGFLSGLLVGAEIGGQRDWIGEGAGAAEIPLIGSETLVRIYAQGLALLGIRSRRVDATDAVLAGLKAARQAGR
jgi:2-dehydro-3-deoxygalactonokinase